MAAHYAARFDNKFILKSLHTHGEPIKLEAGLAKLTWVKPNIIFEDSYLLIPFSLRKAAKMFGVQEKGEWPHELGLKPWEMGESLSTFKAYQKSDCLVLSQLLEKVCETVGWNFGITPSVSIATTSAKAFSKLFFDLTLVQSNEELEEFIREATYGARNEVYKRYGEHIFHYDVNSMYQSCYDTPVPVGKLHWAKPNLDRGTLIEANVKVPKDMYIGPLPYRLGGRLTFPVGEFGPGWWDAYELRNAVSKGTDIIIRRQLDCEEVPILKEFGEVTLKLKQGRLGHFWKLFGVSLSGKLGQSRWRDSIQHMSTIKDFEGYTPVDSDEVYFQTQKYIKGRMPYIKPAIFMRVRAEARNRHFNLLLEAYEKGDLFYGDTDSAFTTASMPTSEAPGGLTCIGIADRGYFIRQKLYGYVIGDKLTQKSSGYSDVKLSETDFENLLKGKDVDVVVESLSRYSEIIKDSSLTLTKTPGSLRSSWSNNRQEIGQDTSPICLPRNR